jgi:hypothetical protein
VYLKVYKGSDSVFFGNTITAPEWRAFFEELDGLDTLSKDTILYIARLLFNRHKMERTAYLFGKKEKKTQTIRFGQYPQRGFIVQSGTYRLMEQAKRQIETMQSSFSPPPKMLLEECELLSTDGDVSSESITMFSETDPDAMARASDIKPTPKKRKQPSRKGFTHKQRVIALFTSIIILGLMAGSPNLTIMVNTGIECQIEVNVLGQNLITGEYFPIHNCAVDIIDANGTLLERLYADYDGEAKSKGTYMTGMSLLFYRSQTVLIADVTVYPTTFGDTTCRVVCYWNGLW